MENRRNLRIPMQAARINPLDAPSSEVNDNGCQNLEELSLWLYGSEMRNLSEAARQEGITPAGLARYLVREYLLWTRSPVGKALARKPQRLKGSRS